MGDDLRPQLTDSCGGQVVRVHTHTAGEDQKICPIFQMCLCRAHDHIQIVVADGHAQNLRRVLLHLRPDHRLELVFNSAGIDLGTGDDHADFLGFVGPQIKKLFLSTQPLRFQNLGFLGHQGDNAHGSKPCADFHGIVIGQGADGDVADGVDLPQ